MRQETCVGKREKKTKKKKLTRWEARIFQGHAPYPLGFGCPSVRCAVGAQMLQSYSECPLWLSAGRMETLRRGPWRSRLQSLGVLLHQSLAGREELAKEPLRSLHSCWERLLRAKNVLGIVVVVVGVGWREEGGRRGKENGASRTASAAEPVRMQDKLSLRFAWLIQLMKLTGSAKDRATQQCQMVETVQAFVKVLLKDWRVTFCNNGEQEEKSTIVRLSNSSCASSLEFSPVRVR